MALSATMPPFPCEKKISFKVNNKLFILLKIRDMKAKYLKGFVGNKKRVALKYIKEMQHRIRNRYIHRVACFD